MQRPTDIISVHGYNFRQPHIPPVRSHPSPFPSHVLSVSPSLPPSPPNPHHSISPILAPLLSHHSVPPVNLSLPTRQSLTTHPSTTHYPPVNPSYPLVNPLPPPKSPLLPARRVQRRVRTDPLRHTQRPGMRAKTGPTGATDRPGFQAGAGSERHVWRWWGDQSLEWETGSPPLESPH